MGNFTGAPSSFLLKCSQIWYIIIELQEKEKEHPQ